MHIAHDFKIAHRHLLRQGVKTNVLFFTKGTAENKDQDEDCTKQVWVYDLRTNMPSFGKRTPFGNDHLAPFEIVYGEKPDGTSPRTPGEWSFMNADGDRTEDTSRWRFFSREWISTQKGDSLDISWIKDDDSIDASKLPEPDVLAAEAMSELTEALRELNELMVVLGCEDEAKVQREVLSVALGLGDKE